MNRETGEITNLIKKELSDFLGIEVEDIEDDFALVEDLHMKPTDLTDFQEILTKKNFPTEKLDFTEIETVEDLVDFLVQHQ